MKFYHYSPSRNKVKLIAIAAVSLFIVGLIAAAVVVRSSYQENLKPLSAESKTHVVTIESGSTTAEIADTLKSKGVIRSDWAFEWYVRNEQLRDQLKAGTYVVDQNQSVQQIVQILVDGKVATDLITILPGRTIDEIKKDFVEKGGYTQADVDQGFDPALYEGHPALTDKPKEAGLEGYLYPESFQKTADTNVGDIVKQSLDETQRRLTPDLRQSIARQGLTLHQGVILASIIENEVTSPEDRAQVAQVFLKRLKEGIKLESNATDKIAKTKAEYDTYKIPALPPGPISNFTESSLKSVAYPAQTDWLYFVSGDDKKTHFSKTFKEHEENIQKYCTTLCGR